MRKTESQKIALCGVLGALSVVLLLVGAALQIGTYAAPMLAAFLLIPVLDEYGPKYALLLYATVSILSVLLVPELELAFFYVFVIGYYPVLRQALARIKSTLLRWIIKFAVFNGATVLVYALLFALLRKVVLQIPLLILLNRFFPPYGIAYAELIAELFLAVVALITLRKIFRQLDRKSAEAKQEVQP